MQLLKIALVMMTFMSLWGSVPVNALWIAIDNASFESPVVDPNSFPVLPMVDQWTELDLDTLGSQNTGVFANTPMDSPDHITNAHGNQLAFLGSQRGNGLEQDLTAIYQIGYTYRLTVAVCISDMFPPSSVDPIDTLELAFYYCDGNEVVDILQETIPATGLSYTTLQDFSVNLPTVQTYDPWANQAIGIGIRAAGAAGGFWDLDHVRLDEFLATSLYIKNASFESPWIDPNTFQALPIVDQWIEKDLDMVASTNTGVFANPPEDNPVHLVNADGRQLAFLGSQQGNGLEQNLDALYRVGSHYRLTSGVGVSALFPPSTADPVDTLELAFYYHDGNETVDIVQQTISASTLSSTFLQDFSVVLPVFLPEDPWVNQSMGIAIRAAGQAGGFWDLDHVRLEELYSVSLPIDNPSFESPEVDPNGFGAYPVINQWRELDLDIYASANTGVFLNTPVGSPDHMINAHGSQLVFLGSQQGNGLEQDLEVSYRVGSTYRLTVGVGTSMRFPPSMTEPVDMLELAFYYRDGNDVVDIVQEHIPATGLSSRLLRDFSIYLAPVQAGDPWANQPMGIAMRSAGRAGGYWDLDFVRLGESNLLDSSQPLD